MWGSLQTPLSQLELHLFPHQNEMALIVGSDVWGEREKNTERERERVCVCMRKTKLQEDRTQERESGIGRERKEPE